MYASAYLNGQDICNFLHSPEEMKFTEKGYAILEPIHLDEIDLSVGCIPFNYVLQGRHKHCGVYFYIQDYQFNRIWNKPDRYCDLLLEHPFVFGPDFSIFMDMPLPIQMFNHYRNMWLSRYWQINGMKVIPNLGWNIDISFDFCLEGMPKNSVLGISTVGVFRDKASTAIFTTGLRKALQILTPGALLVYGCDESVEQIKKCFSGPVFNLSYRTRRFEKK